MLFMFILIFFVIFFNNDGNGNGKQDWKLMPVADICLLCRHKTHKIYLETFLATRTTKQRLQTKYVCLNTVQFELCFFKNTASEG